jgi:regulator of replication initiation timing
MGLFDSWRRKKPRHTSVSKSHDKRKTVSELASDRSIDTGERESINSLLGEYENLVKRREALTVEREELTKKLESGEIETTQFRKELMSRIQEASKVSENLQNTTARLAQLGYRGTLH